MKLVIHSAISAALAVLLLAPSAASATPCDSSAAPDITDLEFDSVSFFYVTLDLDNGNEVILGFEFDGDQWDLSEQYGSGDSCDGQLDTFGDYTLSILTAEGCAAAPQYTPAEEAAIAWYVGNVENACQDNSAPACYPVQNLALTATDASSIPKNPNGCGSMSWCALQQISAWTIPQCLSTPASVGDVTDLVLALTREESALPWGTFLDRAGLQNTRFLRGTGGAALLSEIDAFTGSTNVEGWHFVIDVPCHNCTEFDVTTVLFYPDTGYVLSLDGLYGWDS